MGYGSLRHARADDVSPVSGLLAVDDQPVIDRSVGANDDVVGADDVAIARRDPGGYSIHDLFSVHTGVDFSAVAENRASETFQVLERMEGCLSRKSQRDAGIPEIQRRALDDLGVGESGAVTRLELALEILPLAVAAEKEVAVNALEVAVDVFHRRNRFDPVDRRGVNLGRHARAFAPVKPLEVVVAVIECAGQMGSRSSGLPAADRAIVDEHDRATGASEQVGGGHARDSRAHDADVDAQVLSKWLELRNFSSAHPDGGRVT